MKIKLLSFLLALTLILTLFSALPLTAFAADSDFTYNYDTYGNLNITGYTGSARSFTIPAILDGQAVYGVGSEAFRGRKNIDKVVISEGIQRIGTAAFEYSSITEIVLPDSLKEISSMVFNGTEKLLEITIPKNVETLGSHIFWDCNIQQIDVVAANPYYKSVDGVMYTEDGKKLIAYPTGRAADYTVLDGTEEIGVAAFMNSNVTAVTFPESVVKLGTQSFSGCAGLKSVNFQGAPTVLNGYSFSKCSSLTELTIPEGCTDLGKNLVADCSKMTVLNLPASIVNVDKDIFTNAPKNLTVYLGSAGVAYDAAVAAGLKVVDLSAVDNVKKLVGGLALITSLEQEPQVVAARAAYDALNDLEKDMITNYDLLVKAEETIEGIKNGEITPGLKGDMDGNEKLDVGDIMKMKALIMADAYTEEELANGDMDGSGTLDVGDILTLKAIIMVL